MTTKVMDSFRYNQGQYVTCTNITKENHEGLILGEVYQVIGKSYSDGNQMYAVKDEDGKVHYSMDRFKEFSVSDVTDFCDEPTVEDECPLVEAVPDNVNHPQHYTRGKYEAIDVIEDSISGLPATEGFLTAQVLKYVLRWFWKNGLEDLKKARWYLDRLISKLEK